MKAKMILPSIAIALSGLVGSAHAVTVSGSYVVPTEPFTIITWPSDTPTYYEFIAKNDTDTQILLEGSFWGSNADVDYKIWEDTNLSQGVVSFDETSTPLFDDGGNAGTNPDFFFTFVMEKGKQYVLSILNESASNYTQTNVSAVPLPGALWLFGSALLGFLGFSSRRKA